MSYLYRYVWLFSLCCYKLMLLVSVSDYSCCYIIFQLRDVSHLTSISLCERGTNLYPPPPLLLHPQTFLILFLIQSLTNEHKITSLITGILQFYYIDFAHSNTKIKKMKNEEKKAYIACKITEFLHMKNACCFANYQQNRPYTKRLKKVAPTPCVINFKLELCTPLS